MDCDIYGDKPVEQARAERREGLLLIGLILGWMFIVPKVLLMLEALLPLGD